jgi:hypothetical protein
MFAKLMFETLNVQREGAVLFAEIAAPPVNLLGPELVRDLVSLIQEFRGQRFHLNDYAQGQVIDFLRHHGTRRLVAKVSGSCRPQGTNSK